MSRKKQLESYLRRTGWGNVIKESDALSFDIYTNPQFPLRQIIVPKTVEPGYEEYEHEALRRLCEVERRPREDLQKDIFPRIHPSLVGVVVFVVTAVTAAITYGMVSYVATS